MKEFVSYPGGRTLFNEDIEGLKELALSFSHLFEEAGFDFVISGCSVYSSKNTVNVSEGYVWLDGKIRKFTGATFNGSPQYIFLVPENKDGQSINYNTKGVSGIMSIDYGVVATTSIPSGKSININASPVPNLYTFFSHFALSKNDDRKQTFNKNVKFNNDTEIQKIKVFDENGKYATISFSNDFCIEILLYNQYGILYKEYKIDNGIDERNGNTSLKYGRINKSMQYFPTIIANEATVKSISSNKLVINGKELNSNILDKIGISEWIPILVDNTIYKSLQIKQIGKNVYITGIFPILKDTFIYKYIASAGNHCNEYQTNIILPNFFPLPKENTFFPLRCKDTANFNTSIVCYFKSDRHLYFRARGNTAIPANITNINWHYQI